MRWKRLEPGIYQSADKRYLIEHTVTSEWYVSGPGVDECHYTKAEAQRAAEKANATT